MGSCEPTDDTTTDGLTVVDAGTDGGPSRFELRRDGELVGFANYRMLGRVILVPHVETIVRYRGQGFADRLMTGVVEIARAERRTIVPLCSFAAGHFREFPQHADVLGPAR